MPRPSSKTTESEEDLGLTTLLGNDEALVVGRGGAVESATSGPGDATAVTERVPAREPVIVSSRSQPAQPTTSITTLKGTVTTRHLHLGSRLH